jgi:hypothetical protein
MRTFHEVRGDFFWLVYSTGLRPEPTVVVHLRSLGTDESLSHGLRKDVVWRELMATVARLKDCNGIFHGDRIDALTTVYVDPALLLHGYSISSMKGLFTKSAVIFLGGAGPPRRALHQGVFPVLLACRLPATALGLVRDAYVDRVEITEI